MKMFLRISGITAIVIIAAIFITPNKFIVERSIIIDAPREVVYDQVRKFNNFVNWSPWGTLDTEMTYFISGNDGEKDAVYSWTGNDQVGTGSMTIAEISLDRIDINLDFTQPWESNDLVYYLFADVADGIKVTWGMSGNMQRPMNVVMKWFMNIEKRIGKDYDKGLQVLKVVVNQYVRDHTKRGYMINEVNFPVKNFLIHRDEVKFSDIQQFYSKYFPAIIESIHTSGLVATGAPCGFIFDWDTEKELANMAAGFPINSNHAFDGYTLIYVNGKALHIAYYGPYKGSEEAHYAMDDFMKENNMQSARMVIEEYLTDPEQEADTSKWLTNIYYILN